MASEQRRVTIETLNKSRRGLATLVGLGGLSGGTIAVFESGNQAGTVALLTIGALCSIFGLLGRIPLKWVFGGAEIDMSYDETTETADTLSEVLTPEQMRMVTDLLLQNAAVGPAAYPRQMALAARLSRVSSVEKEGHNRMRRFAALADGWTYEHMSSATQDIGADGILIAPGGTRIAVEFKAWGDGLSKSKRHQRVQPLTNGLTQRLELTQCRGMLVMTDENTLTTELGEFPSVLRRPMRLVTFADGYTFILGKLEELVDAAHRDERAD